VGKQPSIDVYIMGISLKMLEVRRARPLETNTAGEQVLLKLDFLSKRVVKIKRQL